MIGRLREDSSDVFGSVRTVREEKTSDSRSRGANYAEKLMKLWEKEKERKRLEAEEEVNRLAEKLEKEMVLDWVSVSV
ncbi:hypothetical protein D9758_007614 [Tetrapyrgos nigripes]|uniref:Uncharacterized protein n=1 Tax=Tetrapyrgos nigripes TaxID=182062 RepID=A0A8H5LJN5_9AGAR|nr:hypothetical protein D9758_007614 [Tetrapyrgos nigripes]